MKLLALWLLPVALTAGQARYARIGDFDGQVEVQLQAADDWRPVRRNMPIRELSWLRTPASSRVEVELDDGSILRLGPDSQVELSDYTRLSTGQRITLISLDHGLAYFTGGAEGKDSTSLAVPGAQVTIHQSVRLRLEARDPWSLIAAGEGTVRYSSATAEFDLAEGQMVKLDPGHAGRFFLYREIPPLETDRWCDERDKVLLSTTSGAHVPGLLYGLADLDAYGVWIDSAETGTVWKPKAPPGWTPFRNGKWMWYEGLGYTWIADDPWGWLPYHYGRWTQPQDTGWVWMPGDGAVYKPGDVFWMKSARLVGWGPLAPGEDWKPPDKPRQFQNANITYASFAPDAAEVDPASFAARPPEPPAAAVFVQALPSPAFPATRLDAFRPPLRVGSTRAIPVVGTVAVEAPPEPPAPPVPAPAPPASYAPYPNGPAAPVTMVNPPPGDAPTDVDYGIPAYLGIIVVTPPGYRRPPAFEEHAQDGATAPLCASKKPPTSVPTPSGPNTPAPPKPPKPPMPKVPDPDRPVR